MTLTKKKKRILAELSLLLCGIVWGGGFVVMKSSLDTLPVNYLLGMRFLLAGGGLLLLIPRRIVRAGKQTLACGAVAGIAIYIAFYFQTMGLATTTAGNNAFLTAVYVILVPVMQWMVHRRKPGMNVLVAGVLCLSGVGVIALNQFSMAIGDVWTLVGGVFFAAHIVIVAHFTGRGINALELTCVQLITTGAVALAVAAVMETPPAPAVLVSADTVLSLLFLAGVCTLYAMGAQNVSLRYTPASHASLLMGTEAPFGCLFGILLLNEPFTLRFFAGALLIALSIVISEVGHFGKRASAPAKE